MSPFTHMKKIKFIITRFPAGAAGRFLSCCLQLSPDISSWNINSLNYDKSSNEFRDEMLKYFEETFTNDPKQHLRKEPDVPYNYDFYSGTYERGENVTLTDYINYQKADDYNIFFSEIEKIKTINLILHKSKIPEFMKGSIIVNVYVDSSESHDTIAKLLWLKHYNVVSNNTIDNLTQNPITCNEKRSETVKKYVDTSLKKVTNIKDFYIDNVFNGNELLRYKDKDKIVEDDTNKECIQEFINFSDILDSKKCYVSINNILKSNNLRQISCKETFEVLHNHWVSKQYKFLENFTL